MRRSNSMNVMVSKRDEKILNSRKKKLESEGSKTTEDLNDKDLFDPKKEAASGFDDWDEDIRLDVQEECAKFGKIEKVVVDKENDQGNVYVKFFDQNTCQQVAKSFDGRWFDKRKLKVRFIQDAEWPSN